MVGLRATVTGGRGKSKGTLAARVGAIATFAPLARALDLGTLNLVLDRPVLFRPDQSMWSGHDTNFRVYPARLADAEVFILRWKRCRGHVLEIISDSPLRQKLALQDGDSVVITVDGQHLSKNQASWWQSLIFLLVWKKRELWYYKSNSYPKLVGPVELLSRVLQQ